MKKITLVAIALFLSLSYSYGQKKKAKSKKPQLIETITAILSPMNGKEHESDMSYSAELYKKYKIKSFEFHKINITDGSDCNFTNYEGDDIVPVSLNVGETYTVYETDDGISVSVEYKKYRYNEKNPIASKVEVLYSIYKQ